MHASTLATSTKLASPPRPWPAASGVPVLARAAPQTAPPPSARAGRRPRVAAAAAPPRTAGIAESVTELIGELVCKGEEEEETARGGTTACRL